MRDPFAGYVPGQGCGCTICREPLKRPAFVGEERAAELRDAYERRRRGERTEGQGDGNDAAG